MGLQSFFFKVTALIKIAKIFNSLYNNHHIFSCILFLTEGPVEPICTSNKP